MVLIENNTYGITDVLENEEFVCKAIHINSVLKNENSRMCCQSSSVGRAPHL
jgi:hypothetical protein